MKVDLVHPDMRQPILRAYWHNEVLIDGDTVLNVSEYEDENTESCNGVDMSADLGQKTCYICPDMLFEFKLI